MSWTPSAVVIDPVGQEIQVTITRNSPAGAEVPTYTAEHGSDAYVYPTTISSRTAFWLPVTGQFYVSGLDGISETLGRTVLIEKYQVATLTSTLIVGGLDQEEVEDTVGAMLVEGANITITYDDSSGTATIAAIGGGGYSDEAAQDAVGGILVDSSSVNFTYADGTPSITAAVLDSPLLEGEAGSFYLDADNHVDGTTNHVFTAADDTKLAGIASGATAYTDELAQDAVGGILADSAEIAFAYNDATPSISASLVAGSIDESKLDASVNASLDLADSAVQDLSDLGVTATAAELNILDGATLSTTELNYVDGVTSAIQSQLDERPAGGYIVYTQTTTGQPWTLVGGQTADANRPRLFIGPDAPESTFTSYVARDGDAHWDV